MSKHRYALLILLLLANCGGPKSSIERTTENGVEVVLNHLSPYPAGKVRGMTLERLFSIDTENPDVRDLGIPEIFGFDVDSRGRIFLMRTYQGDGDFVFCFDDRGRFVKSFGRKGPGPGELQSPNFMTLDDQDRVLVYDGGRLLISRFDKDGSFLAATALAHPGRVQRGPGGGLLLKDTSMNPERDKMIYASAIKRLGSDDRELGTLDEIRVEMKPGEFNAIEPSLCAAASRDRTFLANESRGYEIRVFDPEGKLVRIIRKEFRPIPVAAAFREKILKPIPPTMKDSVYFPEKHVPFQSLTADENGRLLVATFEPGDKPGEFLYDIFDEDGVFVGRKSLNAAIWEGFVWARLKADKFYCLREKEDGFKEIVVYRLKWE